MIEIRAQQVLATISLIKTLHPKHSKLSCMKVLILQLTMITRKWAWSFGHDAQLFLIVSWAKFVPQTLKNVCTKLQSGTKCKNVALASVSK